MKLRIGGLYNCWMKEFGVISYKDCWTFCVVAEIDLFGKKCFIAVKNRMDSPDDAEYLYPCVFDEFGNQIDNHCKGFQEFKMYQVSRAKRVINIKMDEYK